MSSFSYYYMRFPEGKCKALTLSYDDGVEQDAKLIALMEKYGFKGTFNLNSKRFKPEGKAFAPEHIHRRLSKKDAKVVFSSPNVEVACHGAEHLRIERLNGIDAMTEVLEDRIKLEEVFEKMIRGMAYAYGTYDDQAVDVLRLAGICYSRTVESTEGFKIPTDWLRMPTTCHHNNPRLMELAEKFGKMQVTSSPKLFYLWGHSYEFERDDNWNVIEEFFERMKDLPDVWYATNLEIYDYVCAYEKLQFSAENLFVYNPTCQDVWIAEREEAAICIPAGKTVRLSE